MTLKQLIDYLFPKYCPSCNSKLDINENVICNECRVEMPFSYNWMRPDNNLTELLAARAKIHTASSLMYYMPHSPWQVLIHQLKYNNQKHIAYVLGEIYGFQLAQSPLYSKIDTIIPVPLHPIRHMSRGYNQSEQFAQGIANQLNATVITNSLKRSKHTKKQALKNVTAERWQNVQGAFKVRRSNLLEGKNILLVDDVITTGATIEACAKAISISNPNLRIWVGAIAFVNKKHIKPL